MTTNKDPEEDDDEVVFFGPMGFTEKCIAVAVAEEVVKPLSPLRPEQMAELCKEAYSVAYRISNMTEAEQSPSVAAVVEVLPRLAPVSLFREEIIDSTRKHTVFSQKGVVLENVSSNSNAGHQRNGTYTEDESVEKLVAGKTLQSCDKSDKNFDLRVSKGLPQNAEKEKSTLQSSKLQAPATKLMRFNKSSSDLVQVCYVVHMSAYLVLIYI